MVVKLFLPWVALPRTKWQRFSDLNRKRISLRGKVVSRGAIEDNGGEQKDSAEEELRRREEFTFIIIIIA